MKFVGLWYPKSFKIHKWPSKARKGYLGRRDSSDGVDCNVCREIQGCSLHELYFMGLTFPEMW